MKVSLAPGQNQTALIQKAIDECFLAGGGEVCLQAGEHHTGGLRLRSRVTLHLLSGSRLIGSRNPEDYTGCLCDSLEPFAPDELTDREWVCVGQRKAEDRAIPDIPGSRWNNALIRLLHARDAAIVGDEDSLIDGRDPYDAQGEEGYRGPHGIDAHHCENLRFCGYTIQNTGNWAHALFHCRNLVFENLTALAGHDGVHITDCANVRIENCGFYTGDDCVAGFANVNVLVRACRINTACSAFRFGGTNVYIDACHIFGPAKYVFRGSLTQEEKIAGAHPGQGGAHRFNMLSVFTYYSDFSFPVPLEPCNIVVSRCRVENADRFLHYNFSGNEPWQQNRPMGEIRFEHMDAEGVRMPLTAYGDDAHPVRVTIEDSRIAFAPDADVPLMHLANCCPAVLRNVKIRRTGKSPWILAWGEQVRLETENVDCGETQPLELTPAKVPFQCRAI